MRILLTGATGFFGSHLLEALLAQSHEVMILKRSFSDTWRINHLLADIKSYDVDHVSLETPFRENKIDVVIHTATDYGRNDDAASKIMETNLLFPLRLLELSSLFKADVFFNTDTFFNADALCYEYLNNYALSKKHFADWLKSFCECENIRGINLRIEHMYGPRDHQNKFVNWLLKQLLNNVEQIPLTRGEQMRDFIYVSDVVNAYLQLIMHHDRLPFFSQFEVGTGRAVSIRDFVLKMKKAVSQASGRDIKTRLDFGALPYRPGEPMERKADIAGLAEIGWEPKVLIDKGIEKLIREELQQSLGCH